MTKKKITKKDVQDWCNEKRIDAPNSSFNLQKLLQIVRDRGHDPVAIWPQFTIPDPPSPTEAELLRKWLVSKGFSDSGSVAVLRERIKSKTGPEFTQVLEGILGVRACSYGVFPSTGSISSSGVRYLP